MLEVSEMGTDVQLGNILTKALNRLKFQEMRSRIGMIDVVFNTASGGKC
jgi:hypothetical protein